MKKLNWSKTRYIDFDANFKSEFLNAKDTQEFNANISSDNKSIVICNITEAKIKYKDLINNIKNSRERINKTLDDKISSYEYRNGTFIYLPANSSTEDTINIRIDSKSSAFSYYIIYIDRDNNINILNEFVESLNSKYIESSYFDIYIASDSTASFINTQESDLQKNLYVKYNYFIQKNAHVSINEILLGSSNTLETLNAYLEEEHSSFQLNGTCIQNNEQIFEIDSLINNIALSTNGKITYRNIIKDNAKLLFRGLIRIEEGANFTDSRLEDNTLLIGDNAICDSIPALEINAKEVKASHAATTGSLDTEDLFYISSRGINEEEGKKLISLGFINPILEKIHDGNLRKLLIKKIEKKIYE